MVTIRIKTSAWLRASSGEAPSQKLLQHLIDTPSKIIQVCNLESAPRVSSPVGWISSGGQGFAEARDKLKYATTRDPVWVELT